MGSGPSQTQQQQQNTVSSPWAPAQPMLQSILSTVGGLPLSPSGAQNTAAGNVLNAATGLPNFGSAGTNVVNTLLGGGGASQFAPMYSGALSGYEGGLAPLLNPANLNPYNTPGFSQALDTTNQGITNQMKGLYAGSGRDPAGAGSFFQGPNSLTSTLAKADAPLIQSQYNTNLGNYTGALSDLFGASTGTAGALAGLNQTGLGNMLTGMQGAGAIPGLFTQPAQTQLAAATGQAQLPWMAPSWASSIVAPIAALGGQTNSQGTSTTTGSQSLFGNILGGIMGGAGTIGALFPSTAAGGTAGGLPALLAFMGGSDERIKDNIHRVGMLYDGQPIYSFRYKGEPENVTRVGLMAQDVEKRDPGAVREIGGVKFVDYKRATAPAGLLADMRF